ncbi:helix-turn-helix domain-containing protein [Actinacidiphila oryziradicis]|uniref:Helix-turn-helix domain-containing protein n=1 Tax=Actinacidiphila oryziradicis TaxID=2571141 RepID=A0A4U0SM07_9ACTN|nr:XRE family transcriptional regulator [Actinacidiphila oryziradicis]TKA09211.1 helix-turn-helix domain-containing protein [Actinacidiphila oryziradicis]
MTDRTTPAANGLAADLGQNIRVARKAQNISLRELARRAGISGSALSQIETGKTRPTVKTAYEIARQLGVTLTDLSAGVSSPGGAGFHAAPGLFPPPAGQGDVVRDGLVAHMRQAVEFIPREAQQVVDLQGGEQFRVISGHSLPGANCLLLTYEPGAVSPPGEEFVRHAGHEFNYLAAGRLVIEVGTQRFELKPGDTLTFPATTPHRLSNPWAETAELVCVFVSAPGPRTEVTS